jgi:methionine-S-sulfoxide reductase
VAREGAAACQHSSMIAFAYFAAGCFWGVEAELQRLPGVLDAVSGYQGGHTLDPTYEKVCEGGTGHAETVRVKFDDARVTYGQLLKGYFDRYGADPGGRRGDPGSQYRGAVFAADEAQLAEAKAYVARRFEGREVGTEIELGGPFHEAEERHQNYEEKQKKRRRG